MAWVKDPNAGVIIQIGRIMRTLAAQDKRVETVSAKPAEKPHHLLIRLLNVANRCAYDDSLWRDLVDEQETLQEKDLDRIVSPTASSVPSDKVIRITPEHAVEVRDKLRGLLRQCVASHA